MLSQSYLLFKDISNFNNLNDYLPILNGCINADLIIIFLVFHNVFTSYYLQKWYQKYQLSAAIADILILVIGIILSRFFYKFFFSSFNIWKFTALAVSIQIIHDILFYWLFKSLPRGYNEMLDFFKDYANEVGAGAILGDSFMMIIACLLSSHFATYNLNVNIIILIVLVYFLPYMINY
jgi:uncharacterized protein YacL